MKNFNNETTFVFSTEFIGFTTIPNIILNDTRVSYKALGIYCQILQFQNSPTHSLYQTTLVQLKKDGRDSVAAGIKELINLGYLQKEQLKTENGKFCGVKYTVFLKPVSQENNIEKQVNKSNVSEIGNSHIGISDIGKHDTNNKINKKENIKKENISLSVDDNQSLKSEMTDGQTEYTPNFKIEIENNENGLNNLVVDIVNDLLTSQKTITVNNKKIRINGLIAELKKLDKNNLVKLIEYVAKKFESNNSDNIKNKNKYIVSIFANAVFEKGYLLNDFKNNNHSINTNKQYGKNKFVNYKQEPLDYDLLRKIELQSLKGLLD